MDGCADFKGLHQLVGCAHLPVKPLPNSIVRGTRASPRHRVGLDLQSHGFAKLQRKTLFMDLHPDMARLNFLQTWHFSFFKPSL